MDENTPPYNVWIVLENDAGEMAWWSVDHFDTLEEATEHVEQMTEAEYARTGVMPQRLDD